ncbi:hypothetical protein CDCA_CDCA01G0156 [Cyanidium caldarium]|uniref:CCHC-type domain-containing protein n=1 Tax=Cyanidium caldarium TaxID=2771 RepID=A0AAV9IPW1_CYACA|nr:hypothetical protein CDCA_CDCA01G0156 [Cyanidium caldarium]
MTRGRERRADMPSPSATLDDADPFHATQPNAPFLSPSWGWQGQRGGEPAGLESPAAPSASAPRLPSVTFQVIHNNALEWARITSHRFFDEAQRGKISDAALATYAREWVAWNRHALLQLGWYPNRARRHRSPTAASPQRTGGGPLEGRSDAWAETELPSSASLLVPPSMRAFAWARPLLAEPLHDWMERLEAYRLALGGGDDDDDDDGEAHLPDAVFNNAFVGTPAAARESLTGAYDRLVSCTERLFVFGLLLLAHQQAWSGSLKNPNRPLHERARDTFALMLPPHWEATLLEMQRLFDVQLFRTFASEYAQSVGAGVGSGAATTSSAPQTQWEECLQATLQAPGWQGVIARLDACGKQFLVHYVTLLESICPSLRYKKSVCNKCGRAGHTPAKCTFRSTVD